MVVSPAVLSAQKQNKLSYSAATKSSNKAKSVSLPEVPVASTSKIAEDEDKDEDEEMAEEDGEWQSRTSAAHPLAATAEEENDNDDAVMIDPSSLLPPTSTLGATEATSTTTNGTEQRLISFPALSAKEAQGKIETQLRKVAIPPHRMTPLKRDWPKIYSPLVDECGLMVRMNVNKKSIELKTSKHTQQPSNTILQRAVDFVSAYALGFSPEDSVALLRMEDLFVETFEVKDVKSLSGDHLSRAIGRIAGKDGKTRFTIENVSRTRIVLADSKIHILGTFSSIKIARDAVCALILGSPPGKVYNGLRTVAGRQKHRF